FSPARSERQRNEARREGRRSPMTPSQAERGPRSDRERPPSDRYDTHSYRRAIARACHRADAEARRRGEAASEGEPVVPAWAPNRKRQKGGIPLLGRKTRREGRATPAAADARDSTPRSLLPLRAALRLALAPPEAFRPGRRRGSPGGTGSARSRRSTPRPTCARPSP